jgi:hypothetical protein
MAECKECGKSLQAWKALSGSCGDCRSSTYQKNKPPLKQNLNDDQQELVYQEL